VELVDTHCHIQSIGSAEGERITRQIWAKQPDLTADKVVAEAKEAAVSRLICVGCDLEDSRLAVDFVQERDGCWASVGVHPHEAQHHLSGKQLSDLAAQAARPKVVAIGETGLDYYYEHSPKADQVKLLEFQIELALAADLPLIFHVREAFDDFWPIFDQFKGVRGVLHSYTDSADNLAKGLERGLYIGVNGIATFNKEPALAEVYRTVPLQNLLLETDAPFLTPTPYRGSINEPKRLGAVADFLARLRGESRESLVAQTTRNAQKLFGIT
jgi:TatD DNase family protein